jgi:hypothetical protein
MTIGLYACAIRGEMTEKRRAIRRGGLRLQAQFADQAFRNEYYLRWDMMYSLNVSTLRLNRALDR